MKNMNAFYSFRNILMLAFILMAVSGHAQYFQWAKNLKAPYGISVYDYAVDNSGNSYLAGASAKSGMGTSFFVVKFNSSGKQLWKIEQQPVNASSAIAQSISLDAIGNVYIVGTMNAMSGNISFDSIHSIQAGVFLLKCSPQGTVMTVDSLGNNYQNHYSLKVDSIGNRYITDGFSTVKYSSNGNLSWQNLLYGGYDLGIDPGKRVYLLSSGTLVKLNNKGNFIWSRPHGGNQLAVDDAGNCFIASNDSIFKYQSTGILSWSNKGLHGNSIAVDQAGKIYLALGNSLRKISDNGTTILWSLSTQFAYCKFIVTNSFNCFVGGEYNPLQEVVITPFHFQRIGVSDPNTSTRAFITKVNQTGSVPFQAGIYTPPIAGDRLCAGVYFNVPYFVSLNAVSSFGPGNQFRAQLINPASGDTTDIGKADSAFISPAVTPCTACRVRVFSTNPVVVGDENSPQLLTNDLTLEPLMADISPVGMVPLCAGSSLLLHASQSTFNGYYYWYHNGNYISSSNADTVKTITAPGTYQYIVFTNDFNCQLASPVVSVNSIPLPSSLISVSGPLSFCLGDSVLLSVTMNVGNTYQWKKNNASIPGANGPVYVAKTSGTYKVKVTNASGCFDVSNGTTVSVNCRIESIHPDEIEVYPQPFTNEFTIKNTSGESMEIRIFNQFGQLLMDPVQTGLINMTRYPSGIYFLEIKTNGKTKRIPVAKI